MPRKLSVHVCSAMLRRLLRPTAVGESYSLGLVLGSYPTRWVGVKPPPEEQLFILEEEKQPRPTITTWSSRPLNGLQEQASQIL